MIIIDISVVVIICIINIGIALFLRFRTLKRSYPPERSQIYALSWAFVVFLQYIVSMFVYRDFSDLYTALIHILSIISGITIYVIFRNGYEDDVLARYADFQRLKDELERLAKAVNEDIDEIEYCFWSIDNVDREKIHSSIQEIKMFIQCKDASHPANGALLNAVKELLNYYIDIADIIIKVRGYAAKDYKRAKMKKQQSDKEAMILQSRFFEAVKRLQDERDNYSEKIKALLSLEKLCHNIKAHEIKDSK